SSSQSRHNEGIRKKRILVVEDSRTDEFLMREAMKRWELDVDIDVVRDGEAALDYLDTHGISEERPCPDLILLDLNLPKRSGDEVLEYVRTHSNCRATKVLIVSSSDAPRDRSKVEALRIAGYFRKPSSYSEFMEVGALV